MKREIIIILVCLMTIGIISVVGVLIADFSRYLNFKNSATPLPGGFTYTGHTGCNDTVDNSLESIEVAVKHGVDIVEFDIYHNGKEYVLSHNKPVGGEITLKEAFLKIKEYDGLKANVDVKDDSHIELVQELAKETGVIDRIFFTGVTVNEAKNVSEKCPEISYYLNMKITKPKKDIAVKNYLESITEKVERYGAVGINISKGQVYPELVEYCHEKNLLVSVWTVNKKKEMYRVLSYGVDNVTTRQPDILKEVLENRG